MTVDDWTFRIVQSVAALGSAKLDLAAAVDHGDSAACKAALVQHSAAAERYLKAVLEFAADFYLEG